MKKKILVLLLTLSLAVIGITGCASNDKVAGEWEVTAINGESVADSIEYFEDLIDFMGAKVVMTFNEDDTGNVTLLMENGWTDDMNQNIYSFTYKITGKNTMMMKLSDEQEAECQYSIVDDQLTINIEDGGTIEMVKMEMK